MRRNENRRRARVINRGLFKFLITRAIFPPTAEDSWMSDKFVWYIFVSARMEEEKGVSNVQILWSACQALSRAVKIGPPGTPTDKVIRPLEPEINAVSKAACEYFN